MRSVVSSLIFLIGLGISAGAQSGRRVVAPAAPVAAPQSADGVPYSESQPARRHTIYSTPVPIDAAVLAPSINSTQSENEDVVKITTDLVTIPVSVFDRNGLYIPGLSKENFKIFEDGREQQIAYFGTQDKAFTVALLLDTSPSTQYKIDEIHRAAKAFVDQLNPNDSVIVIEFNSSVKVQCRRTTDRQKIYQGIDNAKFGDGTSLFNAVDEALRKQLSKVDGRKAVVLFTDGVDTTSRKNSYDGTVRYAEESDALIFPIYFNTYSDNMISSRGGVWGGVVGGGIAAGTSAEEYAVGKKYLEDLAEVTGGRVFRPEAVPGGLERAFEGIAEELRRQYNIGYVPDTEGKTGQRRSIRVRVDQPNLVIRARDSYVVGAAHPVPAATPAQK